MVPLRDKLRSRGEPFVFSIKVISAAPRGIGPPGVHRRNTYEYAEFAVVVLQHFRKMGIEAQYWTIENEPDLHSGWYTPERLGERIAVVGERLRAAGFPARLVVPEASRPGNVPLWIAGAVNARNALPYIGQISYHSYDYDPTAGELPPPPTRSTVANWARKLGVGVAQTEQSPWGRRNPGRWTATSFEQSLDLAEQIFADLNWANATEWQLYQAFGVAFSGEPSSGAPVFLKGDYSGMTPRPKFSWTLRQFMRYVRPGAVRVALQILPQDATVRAAAFLAPNGKAVLVAMNRRMHPIEVHLLGLPAGDYRMCWSTRTADGEDQPPFQFAKGVTSGPRIPAESIVTLWQQ
jgi:hypothetical protein